MFLSNRRALAAAIAIPFLTVLLFAGLAPSKAAADETIHVDDARARPTVPNAPSGVVYLTIVNQGKDDTLLSVAASVADSASVHRTEIDNGVTKMTTVRDLPVKAGETVRFAPNGLHIMLIGLKRQLKTGETFPVTLNFAAAGPVTATVSVAQFGAAAHDTNAMPGMKM
jgi:copper(I)-binding protein